MEIKLDNNKNQLSLQSIAGYEEEKAEAIKIINLFKNYDKLKELGISIPKGLLLSGKPGVGKTLMAKVIAAEAGVPLYEYEALEDDTQEKSIINLKNVFERARENAPSIVFIDELDELVCSNEFMSDYSRTTFKTLLTEIDGVKSSEGILTIATTNKYYTIPNQLLRSGRMDKHIQFELPNLAAREAILRLYGENNELLKHINFKEIAVRTNSFSCADLKTLINETLLQSVSNNKYNVSNKDFYNVIPTILFKGIRKKDNNKPKIQVCYHELGHFICEYKLNNIISEISVEKIGNVEGHIRPIYIEEPIKLLSFNDCKNQAIVSLGGYAAEKIFMGQAYNGSSMDFDEFEEIILEMASSGMLSTKCIFTAKAKLRSRIGSSLKDENGNDVTVKCFEEYLDIASKIIEDNKLLIEFLCEKLSSTGRLAPEEIKEYIEEFDKNHDVFEKNLEEYNMKHGEFKLF